jgi:hypothetical protein
MVPEPVREDRGSIHPTRTRSLAGAARAAGRRDRTHRAPATSDHAHIHQESEATSTSGQSPGLVVELGVDQLAEGCGVAGVVGGFGDHGEEQNAQCGLVIRPVRYVRRALQVE